MARRLLLVRSLGRIVVYRTSEFRSVQGRIVNLRFRDYVHWRRLLKAGRQARIYLCSGAMPARIQHIDMRISRSADCEESTLKSGRSAYGKFGFVRITETEEEERL
jgi:hypothetical protein